MNELKTNLSVICIKKNYTLYLNNNGGFFEWTKDKKKFSKAYYSERDAQFAFNSGDVHKQLS